MTIALLDAALPAIHTVLADHCRARKDIPMTPDGQAFVTMEIFGGVVHWDDLTDDHKAALAPEVWGKDVAVMAPIPNILISKGARSHLLRKLQVELDAFAVFHVGEGMMEAKTAEDQPTEKTQAIVHRMESIPDGEEDGGATSSSPIVRPGEGPIHCMVVTVSTADDALMMVARLEKDGTVGDWQTMARKSEADEADVMYGECWDVLNWDPMSMVAIPAEPIEA